MNDQILIVYLFIRLRKLEERLGRTERIMDAVLVPINAGRYLFTAVAVGLVVEWLLGLF